tara:strand:- start:15978 stop:16589 length:612 start_codon:yes stop_codon:yes gene_type:complete
MIVERVCLKSSRPEVGDRCRAILEKSAETSDDFLIVDEMIDATVIISVLYDRILSPAIIHGRRCYNFHPGVLPGYRGAGAFSWAIINREKVSGITLHEIDERIDSGKIISVCTFSIFDESTAEMIFEEAMNILIDMFRYRLEELVFGDYDTTPNLRGRFYNREDLEDERDLTRFVRAFTFDGKPNAFFIDAEGKRHELKFYTK